MEASKILKSKVLIFIDNLLRKIGYNLFIIMDTENDKVLKLSIKKID